MKQLAINVQKNTTIENLACSPNAIVLAKQTTNTNAKTGETTTSVRFLEVCNVEKTDSLTIVQSLLRYCVAEYFVCNDLERDFADTNIKQRKLFNQFLNTTTIYRTDSAGRVANALVSEVPFSQTALKVRGYHTLANCKKENLKAAIYQHAKAILAQCKYLRLIVEKAAQIESEPAQLKSDTPTAKAKTTTAKSAPATAPTDTAPTVGEVKKAA